MRSTRATLLSSFRSFAASHSQITTTENPSAASSRRTRASRSRLAWNLACQNVRFRFGTVARGQPSWECQKHPCTNTDHLPRLFAMSGEPGRSRF